MTTESAVAAMPRISTILGALEAVRNVRAFILTALVLITAVFVVGLFSYMGVRGGSFALGAVGALLAGLIALNRSSANATLPRELPQEVTRWCRRHLTTRTRRQRRAASLSFAQAVGCGDRGK